MDDWVLDCLVGFLKSPTWSTAITSFTDKNCVVFDPGEENKFSYTDIHKQYQKLVEEMLEKFTAELGINGDQFTHACSLIQTSKLGPENEELFDQVLAADDFLLFKGNMVRRNIDLELQALGLLRKQMGHSPQVYDKASGISIDVSGKNRSKEEQRELEEAVKLSEAQYELENSMDEEELKRMIEQAKRESMQLYQLQQSTITSENITTVEKIREAATEEDQRAHDSDTYYLKHEPETRRTSQQNLNAELHTEKTEAEQGRPLLTATQKSTETTKEPANTEISANQTEEETLPPLTAVQDLSISGPQESVKDGNSKDKDDGGANDAMTTWLETAKASMMTSTVTSTSKPYSCHSSQTGPTPEQLREREMYLKRQRDHLLEAKKKHKISSNQSPLGVANSRRQEASSGCETESARAGSSGKKGKTRGKNTGILSSAIARHIKKV